MSKIAPKAPPSSQPVSDDTPDIDLTSTPAPPGHTDQSAFESKTSSPSGDAPAPLDEAFTGPGSSDASTVNEDLIPDPPEEFFDALETLDTELFTLGDARMSRADIKRTLHIVRDMETVLIHALRRHLESPKIPGGAPGKSHATRVETTVPGPDGQPRTIPLRSRKNQTDSVKDHCFSSLEREALVRLAQALPRVTNTNDLNTRMGAFQSDALKALTSRPVEIYTIRALLPIQETGSLAPSDPNNTPKPYPTLTRVTSPMLMEKALKTGALKKPK